MNRARRNNAASEGEFLWLVSLSDLMILLFIFFVVLFSFTSKKLSQAEVQKIVSALHGEAPPPTPIDKIQSTVGEWVKQQGLSKNVSVVMKDDALYIEISDSVLFSSGEAVPNVAGIGVLRGVSKVLAKIPPGYRLGVEGHTDDTPMHTRTIDDNWDLSARRSLAVLHTLDLPPELLKRTVLMAYGEMKPIAPNRDAQGRPIAENQSKNRRVTLRVF